MVTQKTYVLVGRWLPNLVFAAAAAWLLWQLVRQPERLIGAALGAGIVVLAVIIWRYNSPTDQPPPEEQ